MSFLIFLPVPCPKVIFYGALGLKEWLGGGMLWRAKSPMFLGEGNQWSFLIRLLCMELWQFGILDTLILPCVFLRIFSFIFTIDFTNHSSGSRMKVVTIFYVAANDTYRKPNVIEYIQGESGTSHLPFLSKTFCGD